MTGDWSVRHQARFRVDACQSQGFSSLVDVCDSKHMVVMGLGNFASFVLLELLLEFEPVVRVGHRGISVVMGLITWAIFEQELLLGFHVTVEKCLPRAPDDGLSTVAEGPR